MTYFLDYSDKRNEVVGDFLKSDFKSVKTINEIDDAKFGDVIVYSVPKVLTKMEVQDLPQGVVVFVGDFENGCDELLTKKLIKVKKYNENESFLIQNANLTAEATIAVLLENCESSLKELNVLLVGVGRIGKALAVLFEKMGIKYTFGFFSEKDRVNSHYFVCDTLQGNEIYSNLSKFDVVINTIPKLLFKTFDVLSFKKCAVLIETASVDCIEEKDKSLIKFVKASRLPSKYCLKSASRLIFDFIMEENL